MDCSRSLWRRCRKHSTRWFALRATRQTKPNDTHVLHCCVPFCACARVACHAENSARGFRSAQWLHVQWSRILVVHVRQHRLSAFRAFHAAAPTNVCSTHASKSESGVGGRGREPFNYLITFIYDIFIPK